MQADSIYQSYLEEYLNEAVEQMMQYVEASWKTNYFFRDNLLAPYITSKLAKHDTREKLFEFTKNFIDTHHHQLYTAGPVHIFTFSDKETSFLYELFDLSKEQLLDLCAKMFKETYEYDKMPHIVRECPHKVLITAIFVEATQKGYEESAKCCEYLLAFAEYPLIYRSYWKQGVQEDIMKYTIEHLANKFKAKKIDTLLGLLAYDVGTAVTLFKEKIKGGADNVYIDFIYSIRTRINATFRNLAREYYKNHANNATQHSKSGKMDDGHLADNDGHSTNIAAVVENTYSKFLTGGINNSLLKVTAEGNQVDEGNLSSFLTQVLGSKENRLYKLIENIITIYLTKNPTNTSVGSGEFINFGLALYRSIATSKDPLFKEIREILNVWMFQIINITQYYNREGTITNYTRALFNYVVLSIANHN